LVEPQRRWCLSAIRRGGFGAVDACDSVVLVCAPPLLLMATPGAIWSDDDVVPAVFVVSVAVVPLAAPLPVDVDPALVDVESTPVVAVDDSPHDGLFVVEPVELDEADDSDDVPVVSAAATP
jgi:hypothetical protein